MKHKKIMLCITLCVLLMLSLLPLQVFAAGKIDPLKDVALTFNYNDEGTPIEGAKIRLYKVANIDEFAKLTLTETFAPFAEGVTGLRELDPETADDWLRIAASLVPVVDTNEIAPTKDGITTKADGKAQVTVEPGLYLVRIAGLRKNSS